MASIRLLNPHSIIRYAIQNQFQSSITLLTIEEARYLMPALIVFAYQQSVQKLPVVYWRTGVRPYLPPLHHIVPLSTASAIHFPP